MKRRNILLAAMLPALAMLAALTVGTPAYADDPNQTSVAIVGSTVRAADACAPTAWAAWSWRARELLDDLVVRRVIEVVVALATNLKAGR